MSASTHMCACPGTKYNRAIGLIKFTRTPSYSSCVLFHNPSDLVCLYFFCPLNSFVVTPFDFCYPSIHRPTHTSKHPSASPCKCMSRMSTYLSDTLTSSDLYQVATCCRGLHRMAHHHSHQGTGCLHIYST